MKNTFFYFLLVSQLFYPQVKKSDINSIYTNEIVKYHTQLNYKDDEKVVISLAKITYEEYIFKSIKTFASDSGLSDTEINEIFGKNIYDLYNLKNKSNDKWCKNSFKNIEVELYDAEGKPKNIGFKSMQVMGISKVVVRKDQKYALVQTVSDANGGVLSIYKATENGWEFYKNIQIFYI